MCLQLEGAAFEICDCCFYFPFVFSPFFWVSLEALFKKKNGQDNLKKTGRRQADFKYAAFRNQKTISVT